MTAEVTSKNGISIRLTDERWAHIIEEHEKTVMAIANLAEYLRLVPAVKQSPEGYVWLSYDPEADALYINFKKPSFATDSEITDEDVVVRYEGDQIIGLTVLHASTR